LGQERIQFGGLFGPQDTFIGPGLVEDPPRFPTVNGVVTHDGRVREQPK
jgi:hypothetical protein